MSTDAEVLAEAAAAVERGARVVVATVVKTTGSTPRKAGAKMIVRDDGSVGGTIGGGCIEAEVQRAAVRLLREGGPPRVETFVLDDATAGTEGLRCGGSMEVYLERMEPRRRLAVVGAGHVGAALAAAARAAGFEVAVIDDHPGFANEGRFPGCRILLGPWATGCAAIEEGADTAVVVATRGHASDFEVLRAIVRRRFGYLGLLSSKKKLLDFYRPLLSEGVPLERLRELRAPVGLDVGAETPEEIAVSILAEILAAFRGASGGPLRDAFWRGGGGRTLEKAAASAPEAAAPR